MYLLNRYLLSGLGFGILGLLYYANFREATILFDRIPLFSFLDITNQPILLPQFIDNWLPSFVYVCSMSLITYGLVGRGKNSATIIPLFWGSSALILEFLQTFNSNSVFTAGYFDWFDIAAIAIGTGMSVMLLKGTRASNTHTSFINNKKVAAVLLPFGLCASLGSNIYLEDPQCTFAGNELDDCEVDYLYVSDNQLRRADGIYFSNENANQFTRKWIDEGYDVMEFNGIANPGKILVFNDLLFVNDRFRGTFMFDNSQPKSPKFIAFAGVIGNQDIALHNGTLYLDSFMDIVAIDLSAFVSDSQSSIQMFRNRDVLDKTDPFKLLPEGVYSQFQPSRGVAIGYKRNDGTLEYFWEFEL